MKTQNFRVVALETEIADAARQAARQNATSHAVITARSARAFPCRHCLKWAGVGEKVVLFTHEAIAHGHPYSESGPIFVHLDSCDRYSRENEFPDEFRQGRALRAYNSACDMIDAQLANGSDPEEIIENFFQNPQIEFVDVRSADRGCYTFRIIRK